MFAESKRDLRLGFHIAGTVVLRDLPVPILSHE